MGNSTTSKIIGYGIVDLLLCLEKLLPWRMFFMCQIVESFLFSVFLLSYHRVHVLCDKMILSKNGSTFIWNGCVKDKMYLLSIMNKTIANASYVCDVHDVWHCRLGHITKKTLDKMITLELVPKHISKMSSSECEYYVQEQRTRKPFKVLSRNYNISQDICDNKVLKLEEGKCIFSLLLMIMLNILMLI